MELTKRERQLLALAIGVAMDKERHAIESLSHELPARDIKQAIDERIRHVTELDRLRERLNAG
jgi:hypothetical protein